MTYPKFWALMVVASPGLAFMGCDSGSSGSGTTENQPDPPNNDPGLLTIEELQYEGAFRLSSDTFGASSTNYAVGTLAYNPENHSLFIAGHATGYSIAEFTIPVPSIRFDRSRC